MESLAHGSTLNNDNVVLSIDETGKQQVRNLNVTSMQNVLATDYASQSTIMGGPRRDFDSQENGTK